MSSEKHKLRRISIVAAIVIVAEAILPFLSLPALAATAPSHAFLRLDRMKTGLVTTGAACIIPTAGTTITSVVVTFPAGFTVGAAASFTAGTNVTQTLGWPTNGTNHPFASITALPSNVSGQAVTWTVSQTSPVTTDWYCFNFGAGITNPASNPSLVGQIHTSQDTTDQNYAVAVIADDTIVVNATTVPPIFTFALSANTIGFTANKISTINSVAQTGTVTATVSTNASKGWMVLAQSTTGATKGSLNSVQAGNYKITSPRALASVSANYSGSNEDYGLGATTSVGTPDAAYNGASAKYGVLDSQFMRNIASDTTGTGSAVVTMTLNAAISATTPAATDYTDTLEVVGAGEF